MIIGAMDKMQEEIKVFNGGRLRFHAVKTDKFKMSRLSFNFILPADVTRSPITRLMLATMMRGCKKYPTVIDINKRLDSLYGATVSWRPVAVGERHVFKISCEMLSNKYRLSGDSESIVDEVCRVVLEILMNPILDENGLLPASHFESEKRLMIDAINAKINDQKAYAAEQCARRMFEGSRLAVSSLGTVEQVEKITLEDVSRNLNCFLKNSILECYYYGNDDIENVMKSIDEAFSGIGRDEIELVGKEYSFDRHETDARVYDDALDVGQSRLCIGCIGKVIMSDSDYYAMCVFNEIFGGSSVGKLFLNVREKESLCYYCYSSYHSATGAIMIGCGIKAENRYKAYDEILRQLDDMKNGNFTENDIATAKRTLISGLKQTYDSPSATEAFGFRRYLAGISAGIEESICKVSAVSRDDIVRVAQGVRPDTVYFLRGSGIAEDYENE